MIKERIIAFDGSMNEVADSKILKDNISNEIINFEHKEKGILTKRIDPMQFDSNLEDELTGSGKPYEDGKVTYIPEDLFYPSKLPSDIYSEDDYLIPVFGYDLDEEYKLCLCYRTSATTWTYERIKIDGIIYSASSEIRINYAPNMMIVSDYEGNNITHYVTITDDGDIVYDLLQMPRPINKPVISALTEYDQSLFEEDSESNYIGYTGNYRYYFTIVSKFGDESNPSPASQWFNCQFNKLSDDLIPERWIAKIVLKELQLPSGISSYAEEIAKYFRIYRESLEFSEGVETTIAKYIAEIEIAEKKGENSFTDTIAIVDPDSLPTMSYENDIAPISKDNCYIGGAIVLGGIKTKIQFPFDFDYYKEIIITNNNGKTFQEGVVRLEMDYSSEEYDNDPDWIYLMSNKDKVRFFDTDLSTPIPVLTKKNNEYNFAGLTDHITDNEFNTACGVNWTCGANWSISATYKYASNTTESSATDMKESSALVSSTKKYMFVKMKFQVSGDSLLYPTAGLNVFDYYLMIKDGSGIREETFIALTDESTDFIISKSANCTVPLLDDVYCYGAGSGTTIVQNVRNAELTGGNFWTNTGSWTFDGDYARNSDWMEIHGSPNDSYIDGDTDPALTIGNYYLVTICCSLSGYQENEIYVALNSRAEYGHGLSGSGAVYASFLLKAITDNVRIFKTGLGKPIVYYCRVSELPMSDANKLTTYLNIPKLPISGNKKIYLTYCKSGGSAGVTSDDWRYDDSDYTKGEYGEFLEYDENTQWNGQKVFKPIQVENHNSILCSPMEIEDDSLEIYNRANINYNGGLNTASWETGNISYLNIFNNYRTIGSKNIILDSGSSSISFNNISGLETLPNKGYVYGRIRYKGSNLFAGDDANHIFHFKYYVPSTWYHRGITIGYTGSEYRWSFASDSGNTDFDNIAIPLSSGVDYYYFLLMSWDIEKEKVSLFVIPYDDILDQSFDGTNWCEELTSIDIKKNDFTGFVLGDPHGAGYNNIDEMGYDEFQIIKNKYLSAESDSDRIAVGNIANFMPATDIDPIGYNFTDDSENNNISGIYSEPELIEYKEKPNWLAYSKSQGMVFPDMYIKKCFSNCVRVVPVPSYLKGQTQYKNTVLVFYRNGFNVFALEGSPSTWADSVENLIPEKKRFGLLSDDSLSVTPYGVLWLSEAGVILWNASALKNISRGVMDIPLKQNLKGIYLPLTQQYMLHENDYSEEEMTLTFTKGLPDIDDTITSSATNWRTEGYKVGNRIFISGSLVTNGVLTLDGNGDYVKLNSGISTATPFSLTCKFRINENATGEDAIITQSSTISVPKVGLFIDNDNKRFICNMGLNGAAYADWNGYETGKWHRITICLVNSTTVKFWIDDTLLTTTGVITSTSLSLRYIGIQYQVQGGSHNLLNAYYGYLNDMAMYLNEELDSDDVANIVATDDPTSGGTVNHRWTFDTDFTDSGDLAGNDGIAYGDAAIIETSLETNNNQGFTITAIDLVNPFKISVAESVTNESSVSVTVRMTKSYVYDIPENKWTTFEGLDILYASVMSGGDRIDNVNLFLDSYSGIDKYPDYANGSQTSILATVKKIIDNYYADYEEFEPFITGSGTYDVTVNDDQNSESQSSNDNEIVNLKANHLPFGYFGNQMELTLKNCNEVHNVVLVYNPRQTRR